MAAERVEQQELGEIVALRQKAKDLLALADEKARGCAKRFALGCEGGMYRGSLDGKGALVIVRVDGTPL